MENVLFEPKTSSLKFELYHRENQQWLSNLSFIRDEIQYFETWMEHLRELNLSRTLQNEWIALEEQFAQERVETQALLKAIEHEEFLFGLETQQKDFQLGEEHYLKHRNLRVRFRAIEKDFHTSKHSFYEFMTDIMN
ncbi:hypothetical protein [Flectobacillus roseus]|uniref:Uncharacterized protein n=1 Tax=Flectobacillus roseus TaxID=502259 RepID=A0ABT6Y7Y4_9BACT|nr:hypothetical protein [Flectobacillus roseus]MDI9859361.1 hypothetical protein [Flectobacillus roseus]MDI9868607.1 hypothetical protein [Flectobacillus roseus]NBA77209.1 hypothetical protein [Emticicia sp. ODNR4P]